MSVISIFLIRFLLKVKTVPDIQLVKGSTQMVGKNVGQGKRKRERESLSLNSFPLFCSCHFSHCSLTNRTLRAVYLTMVITFVVLLLSALFPTNQLKNSNNYLFISQVCSNLVSRYCAWVFTKGLLSVHHNDCKFSYKSTAHNY